jgi:ABC-type taurine transport system ATPase subunit
MAATRGGREIEAKRAKVGRMSQKRGPFPYLSLIGTLALLLAVAAIDRITNSDVIAAIATIVILGAYIAWWFWRHRYL